MLFRLCVSFILAFFFTNSIIAAAYAEAEITEHIWTRTDKGIARPDIRFLATGPSGSDTVYAAASVTVYVSTNGGTEWEEIFSLKGTSNQIDVIAAVPDNPDSIFVGTGDGLYRSNDRGSAWEKIFSGIGQEESSVLAIAFDPDKSETIYIGTRSGIFITENNGKYWAKAETIPSGTAVLSIAVSHSTPDIIYAATNRGVFKTINTGKAWERILSTNISEENSSANEEPDDSGPEDVYRDLQIRSIIIDPENKNKIYIGTSRGLYVSTDTGLTWETTGGFGLINRNIQHIIFDKNIPSAIFAATGRGVFRYSKEADSWKEIYRGLPATDIRNLVFIPQADGKTASILAATDKGVFRLHPSDNSASAQPDILSEFDHEPSILEIREAAIDYAEVHPDKISKWRKAAERKAWLPDLRFEYQKNRNWQSDNYFYSGSYVDDDITIDKDREWSVSLTWELGDILWSSDQTSIDTRSRLMVQLRDDVLNEVTRLYFERRRLQAEMLTSPQEDIKKRIENELRLQELTANIDSLTGSYLSKRLNQ